MAAASDVVWRVPPDNNGSYDFIVSGHPNIPTRRFEAKDLGMLVRVFSEVHAEWVGIGYSIRIPNRTMEALERRWAKSTSLVRGLMCVLDEWLRGNFEVTEDENLFPCWRSVVYVVSYDLGGKDARAASTIAEKWQEYESNPFFGTKVADQHVDNTVSLSKGYDRKLEELFIKYLKDINFKWFEVGVILGVPVNILIEEVENISESQRRIIEAIKKWLKLYMSGGIKYFPLPTMRALLVAVEDPMGGANQQLARKIAADSFVTSLGGGNIVGSQPKQGAGPSSSSASIIANRAHSDGSLDKIRVEERDIPFLVKLIGSKAFKWQDILGQCGLLPSEVQAIATDMTNILRGHSHCLTLGLTEWCNISPQDGRHISYPTLNVLVSALRGVVVKEGVLAQTVQNSWMELPSVKYRSGAVGAGSATQQHPLQHQQQQLETPADSLKITQAIPLPVVQPHAAKIPRADPIHSAGGHECEYDSEIFELADGEWSQCFAKSLLNLKTVHKDYDIIGSNTRLAIIERGCYATHEALKGKVKKVQVSSFDGSLNHGTAVAGIAAGQPYTSGGTSYPGGVAPDTDVTMFCVDSSIKSLLEALKQISQHKGQDSFDVLSISLGTHNKVDGRVEDEFQEVIETIRGEGTVIFAASGNIGKQGKILFPAYLEGVIKVGGLDRFGEPLSSARKEGLDIYCCGEVWAPTSRTNGLELQRGSSMATPAAAGLACLAIQLAKDCDYKGLRRIHKIKSLFKQLQAPGSTNVFEPHTFLVNAYEKGLDYFNEKL